MRVLLAGLALLLVAPVALLAAIALGPVSLLILALIGTVLAVWGASETASRRTRIPRIHG